LACAVVIGALLFDRDNIEGSELHHSAAAHYGAAEPPVKLQKSLRWRRDTLEDAS
jgi:hypothetical protein